MEIADRTGQIDDSINALICKLLTILAPRTVAVY